MTEEVIIIDYGAGNLSSIQNMVKRIGRKAVITAERNLIDAAAKLILPGVGHFDHGMSKLVNSGIIELLQRKVMVEKVPILGICLGAQLLTEGSDEGTSPGLRFINGKTISFNSKRLQLSQKVPHMGWREIVTKKESPLLWKLPEYSRFYFVHSYHLMMHNSLDTLATATYGYEFTAAYENNNILGVQFHPEKSHKFGMQLLSNFINNY